MDSLKPRKGLFESVVLVITVLVNSHAKRFHANKGDQTVLSKIIILRRGTGVNANRKSSSSEEVQA